MPTEDDFHFELLTRLLAETIDGLVAVRPSDPRFTECQPLLEKLLQHTLSMRLLQNRPQPLPLGTQGVTVYDFPSTIVLSRAVFETFLTLHDVFFAPESKDDFEFGYHLWRIRGFVALQSFDTISGFGADQHRNLMTQLDECRARLRTTHRFQTLTTGQQNNALQRGKDDTQPPRDYEAAGFAPDVFKRIYGYTSSYVHADGHAAFQIRSARTHQEQRNMMGMSLSIAMMAIARTVLELEKKFPEIQATTQAMPLGRGLADVYSGLAMRIGNPKDREEVRQQVHKLEKE